MEESRAGLSAIETAEHRHRKAPDRVIPEKRSKRTEFVRWDYYAERQVTVSITGQRDGKRVPLDGHDNVLADAREVEVEDEDVTPEQIVPGAQLPGLAGTLVLPPVRPASPFLWPRPS
jgi:hypothetical protein